MNLPIFFNGTPIAGYGRGTQLTYPTINIDTTAVPTELEHGIYAGIAMIDGDLHQAAIHYGPITLYDVPESFEVHVLDTTIDHLPEELDIEIVGRIRDVESFDSAEALQKTIASDIEHVRAIIAAHDELA